MVETAYTSTDLLQRFYRADYRASFPVLSTEAKHNSIWILLLPSTISVTTSFVAVYLTFRRSPFFALGYAANDVVLIVLWVLASITDARYISVVVCFAAFLINDIYGFLSWRKMKERQKADNANA